MAIPIDVKDNAATVIARAIAANVPTRFIVRVRILKAGIVIPVSPERVAL